jgi:phage tail-like protein
MPSTRERFLSQEGMAMAVLRDKPYAGMYFVVDLGSGDTEGVEAGLAEVVFPEARVRTYEYRNGNERETGSRKVQATTQYGNLILRRGAIGSLAWYTWWDVVRNGQHAAVRTVVVKLLNEDRTEVVLTWKFLRARPVAHQFSTLNALTGETLLESLEVAFERLEME